MLILSIRSIQGYRISSSEDLEYLMGVDALRDASGPRTLYNITDSREMADGIQSWPHGLWKGIR